MRLHVLLVCSLRSLPPGSAAEELVGSSACSQCSAHSALNEAVQPSISPVLLGGLGGVKRVAKESTRSQKCLGDLGGVHGARSGAPRGHQWSLVVISGH